MKIVLKDYGGRLHIKIASKLQPFSHTKGVVCQIPCSFLTVQIFPTLLRCQGKEIKLPTVGPVKNFTVTLDLERGCVTVFGTGANGFKRYHLFDRGGELQVDFEKAPPPLPQQERLSLGAHRAQDWDQTTRRGDLKELFPAWLRLSQLAPEVSGYDAYLLNQIKQANREDVGLAFQQFFEAHFTDLMQPRLYDDQHQGLIPETESISEGSSPLFLLKQSGTLIRSLFIQEGEKIALLPHLPPELHAGRYLNVTVNNGDQLDMEWSKKLLRRVIWRPSRDSEVRVCLQKAIQSFRVRNHMQDKGYILERDEPLRLQAGQLLYLDRFQK